MAASNYIERFLGYTLVDITPTRVIKNYAGNISARNQQRNWETVKQAIGLRSQMYIVREPICMTQDTSELFGEEFAGHHAVWCWEFRSDHPSAYQINDDPCAGLYVDFKNVPIVDGLSETVKFTLPIFYTSGANKNIHFVPHPKY